MNDGFTKLLKRGKVDFSAGSGVGRLFVAVTGLVLALALSVLLSRDLFIGRPGQFEG